MHGETLKGMFMLDMLQPLKCVVFIAYFYLNSCLI